MDSYRNLLNETSNWFQIVQNRHADLMQCRSGCTACCSGLFDISLPDALHVTAGMAALPADTSSEVTARAQEIQRRIVARAPDLAAPYLLKMKDELLIDRITARIQPPRCPFLSREHACLIYEHRPLACRLEGVPMVDAHDGLFGDWCEFNFPDGVGAESQEDLQRDYYALQEVERSSTASLSELLLGERLDAVTVFIPSLIVGYESFWAPLLAKLEASNRAPAPREAHAAEEA